jgi:spermidine/putrescine-binding protein
MRHIILFILLLSAAIGSAKAQATDSSLHAFSWKEYNKDRVRIFNKA